MAEIGRLPLVFPNGIWSDYELSYKAESKKVGVAIVLSLLRRGPSWSDTPYMSCAIDCAIVVGIFLSEWNISVDGDVQRFPRNEIGDAWVKAIQHEWTLDKDHTHDRAKASLKKASFDMKHPKSGLLAYSAVWSKCAIDLQQVQVRSIVITIICNKCSSKTGCRSSTL